MARRGRGEGSIIQVHGPTWDCPEPVEEATEDGQAHMVRPKHRCIGPWRATLDLGSLDGKRRRVTVQRPTKREVLGAMDELRADRTTGVVPTQVTVSEWLDVWIDTARLKPYTARGYRGLIANHIKPALGARKLQLLTAVDVRAMIRAMEDKGLAAATIRQAHSVLRRALTIAERDRIIKHNPARHVELPAADGKPHAILTPEQARAVIDCTEDMAERARHMVSLMAGLRQGEALALRWGDLNLDAGRMHVSHTVARVGGQWIEQESTKSRRSTRTIHMAPALTETLRLVRGGARDDEFLFPGRPGEPVMPRADHEMWRAACRRAGVPEVPLHGARGTLETMLIHAGVTMTDSAAMLGHDPVTAARHYARATQASQAALAAQVETLLGGPPALEP